MNFCTGEVLVDLLKAWHKVKGANLAGLTLLLACYWHLPALAGSCRPLASEVVVIDVRDEVSDLAH